ncbi:hypothetical protein B0T10DRAFT_168555 [Thelonectria olida]|uniref:Uncharacterized protein n=1 Tax=Thelonectria olida TaxID=1576542 RepID=A0A9P8WHD7_9HYPO|nr:hypothetical protein B0T10DRAFT_168555 [Thelonectria olida]
MGVSIVRLTIPAFHAINRTHTLDSMMPWMSNLETIYVPWNDLPHIREHSLDVQPRYELEAVSDEGEIAEFDDPYEGGGSVGFLSLCLQEMAWNWSFALGVPDRIRNSDTGELCLPLVHVTAKRVTVYS